MKNFMKVVIMAIVLLTTTSCGVLDTSLQRSRLAESLHTGMTLSLIHISEPTRH